MIFLWAYIICFLHTEILTCLALKQAFTRFTGAWQWWKLLSWSFTAFKQTCTCLTAPQHWFCHSFMALKTCFHELHRTSYMGKTSLYDLSGHSSKPTWPSLDIPVVKTTFSIFPSTWRGMHELHSTSTLVLTAMSDLLALKQACTCLTDLQSSENCFLDFSWHLNWHGWASQGLQWLYTTCLALKQASTSFTGPSQWWKLLFLALKQASTSFTGTPQLGTVLGMVL